MMTTALYAQGVRVWPEAAIKELALGRAVIHTETGLDMTLPCDAIVNAQDMLPNTALLEGVNVRIRVKESYAVGDCAEPFNIAMAIRAGNDAGRTV